VRLQIIDVEEIGDFSMAPMCTPHPPQQFTDALDWLAGNGRILVKSQAFLAAIIQSIFRLDCVTLSGRHARA